MKNVLLIISLSLILSGCITVNQSQPSAPLTPVLSSNALRAEIEVGEKINGKSSINILFGFLKFGGDTMYADGVYYSGVGGGPAASPLDFITGFLDVTASVKSAAAYNAVNNSRSDIIVHPQYVMEVKDYFIFKRVTAYVSGYKGVVKGIR